jgi:hypothetical protein
MKYVQKIALFTLLFLSSLISGAASSSDDTQSIISVAINGKDHLFNRKILMHIPYFRVLLEPQELGKTYYEIDKPYLEMSDQENMAKLPDKRLLDSIAVLAKAATPITLELDSKQHRALIILYNLLHSMENKQFSDQEIIDRLKQSSIPLEAFYQTIYAFFSNDAIKRAFDEKEIEILQQTIARSSTTNISHAIFSPAQDMLSVILSLIKAEKKEIRVACYLLNNTKIIDALVQAIQRGIRIQIIIDAEQISDVLHSSNLSYCAWKNIVSTSSYPPKMHNKFFIFSDNIFNQSILVTGSANCTLSAQNNNWENLIVSNNPELITQFSNRFDYLLQSSHCTLSTFPPKLSTTKSKNFMQYYSPGTISLLRIAHTIKKDKLYSIKRNKPIGERTSPELPKYPRH